jgi:hypothetical protein
MSATVKVKLTCSRTGDRFTQQAGQVVEVPHDEALRLLANNLAERVDETIESAALKPAKAHKPKGAEER